MSVSKTIWNSDNFFAPGRHDIVEHWDWKNKTWKSCIISDLVCVILQEAFLSIFLLSSSHLSSLISCNRRLISALLRSQISHSVLSLFAGNMHLHLLLLPPLLSLYLHHYLLPLHCYDTKKIQLLMSSSWMADRSSADQILLHVLPQTGQLWECERVTLLVVCIYVCMIIKMYRCKLFLF